MFKLVSNVVSFSFFLSLATTAWVNAATIIPEIPITAKTLPENPQWAFINDVRQGGRKGDQCFAMLGQKTANKLCNTVRGKEIA